MTLTRTEYSLAREKAERAERREEKALEARKELLAQAFAARAAEILSDNQRGAAAAIADVDAELGVPDLWSKPLKPTAIELVDNCRRSLGHLRDVMRVAPDDFVQTYQIARMLKAAVDTWVELADAELIPADLAPSKKGKS